MRIFFIIICFLSLVGKSLFSGIPIENDKEWRFVSLSPTSITSFYSDNPLVDVIVSYTNSKYKIAARTNSAAYSAYTTLTDLSSDQGYWVKLSTGVNLTQVSTSPTKSTSYLPSWYMISGAGQSVDTFLAQHGEVSTIYSFVNQRWAVVSRDHRQNLIVKEFSQLEKSKAYWIKSSYNYYTSNQVNAPNARKSHMSLTHNSSLYSLGGERSNLALNSVDQFSFATHKWVNHSSLLQARYDHSAVVFQDVLYVYGGVSTNGLELSSLESLQVTASVNWNNISNTTNTRSGHSSVVSSGEMLVIGGFLSNSSTNILTNQMDAYSFINDSWSIETIGGTPRIHHQSVIVDNFIYIIGGTSKHFDIYDINTKSWTRGPDLSFFRTHHNLYVYDNCIYIIGGQNEKAELYNQIWKYSITAKSWDYSYKDLSKISKFGLSFLENKLYITGGEQVDRVAMSKFEIVSIDATNALSSNRQVSLENLTSLYSRGLLSLTFEPRDLDSDLFYTTSLSYQINSSSAAGFKKTTKISPNPEILPLRNKQTIVWNSKEDLGLDYDNVWLRFESLDQQGASPNTLVTGPIAINNGWPQVTSIQTQNTSSDIAVNFSISDVDNDDLAIRFEYSTDDGFTWNSSSSIIGVTSGLSVTNTHSLTWTSYLDIQGDYDLVKLRLSISDTKTQFIDHLVSERFEVFNGINDIPTVKNIRLLGAEENKTLLLRPRHNQSNIIIGSSYSLDNGLNWILSDYISPSLITTQAFNYLEIESLINDKDNHKVNVELKFKGGSVTNYQIMTGIISPTKLIDSEQISKFVWLSSVDISQNMTDLQISIRADDIHLGDSEFKSSQTFEIFNGNIRPKLIVSDPLFIGTSSISSLSEKNGITSFVVSILDTDSTTFDLEFQYSFDNIIFTSVTDEYVSGKSGILDTNTNELIHWLSSLNIKLDQEFIYLRLRVFDQKQYSPFVNLVLNLTKNRFKLEKITVPELQARAFHSSFEKNNSWFLLGGRNALGYTTSIQKVGFPGLDVTQEDFVYQNSNFSASLIGENAFLYGGISQNSSTISSTLNVLDFSSPPLNLETYVDAQYPRIDHCVVNYAAKTFYFGGQSSAGINSKIESYSPSSGWVNEGSFIPARYGHDCIVHENKVWIFGGFSSQSGIVEATSEVLIYNLQSKVWETRATKLKRRAFGTAKLWNGKVLLSGGFQRANTITQNSIASLDYTSSGDLLVEIESYNLKTNAIQFVAKTNEKYAFHESLVKNDTLYTSGGLNELSQVSASILQLKLQDQNFAFSNQPSRLISNSISGDNSNLLIKLKVFDGDTADKSYVNLEYTTDNFANFHTISRRDLIGKSKDLASNTTYSFYWDTLHSLGQQDFTSIILKYTVKDSNLGTAFVTYSDAFPVYNGESSSPVVSNLTRLNARDEIKLSFDLYDPENDSMRISLDYSIDGTNYTPASIIDPKEFYSSKNSNLLTWDSMKDIPSTTNVSLRLNVNDKHIGSTRQTVVSTFSLLNGHGLPFVSKLIVNGGRFDIEVRCHLQDSSSVASSLGLSLFYSTDKVNFFLAKSIEGLHITSNNGDVKFTWHSIQDIVTDESVMYIKLVPRDEIGIGQPVLSDVFTINNNNWSEDFTLKTPRTSHSSVSYQNRIYLWGGQDTTGNFLNTLEMYDPNLGEWRLLKSGGTKRMNHTAVVFGNLIYFWGGENLNGRLNSTDVYDIDNNSWSTKASGGQRRTKHSAHLYKDQIYYFGGRDVGSSRFNSIDIYDIINDSFYSGLSGGTGRDAHVSALLYDKVFLFGGLGQFSYEDSLDIYELNPWKSRNTNISRAYHTSEKTTGGQVYIIGGTNSSNIVTNSIDVYDITSDDLELKSTFYLNNARKNHSSAIMGDYIYVIGGEDGINPVNNIERFSLVSNSSTIFTTINLSLISSKAVAYTSSIYVLGGMQNNALSKNVLKLSTSTSVLTTLSLQLSQAKKDFTATLANSHIYVVGGYDGSVHLSMVDNISLINLSVSTSSLPAPLSSHVAEFWNDNLFISGGLNSTSVSTKVYSYSLKNSTWQNDVNASNMHIGASSIEFKDRMYIMGGFTNPLNFQTKTSIYSQWRKLKHLAIRRSDAEGVVIGTKWHIFGGNDSGLKNDQIIFDTESETFSYGDSGGVVKQNMTVDLVQDQVVFIGGTSSEGVNDKVERYNIPFVDNGIDYTYTGNIRFVNSSIPEFIDGAASEVNGYSYIFGGSQNGTYKANAYRLNGSSLDSISITSMPENLAGHSVANNGQDVFLFGGTSSSVLSSSVFKYDIKANTYQYLDSLIVPRKNHSSTFYNSRIYLHGGENSTGITSGIDIYNIRENIWTRRSTKTLPRTQHTATLYKGRIIYIGGKTSSSGSLNPTSSVAIYFIDGNRWIEGVSMPVELYDHTVVLQGQRLYVYGGYDKNDQFNDRLHSYDLSENKWVTPQLLSTYSRSKHSSFVSQSKIVSVGGTSNRTNNSQLEILDLDFVGGNYQGTIDSLVNHRFDHNVVAYDDSVYIFGGSGHGSDKTDIYHQDLKLWTETDTYPSKALGTAIVDKDGVVYRWGGTGSSVLDQIETWNLPVSGSLLSNEINGSDKKLDYSVNTINEKIYYIGGSKSASEISSTISIYNPLSSQWEASKSIALNKKSHCSFIKADGNIIIVGGQSASGLQTNIVQTFSVKNLAISTIDISNNLSGYSEINLRSNAVCYQTSNVAYIAGGIKTEPTTSYLDSIYELNVDNLTLINHVSNDYTFAKASSSFYKNNIYIYGGKNANTQLNSFRKFDIVNKKWSTLPSGLLPRSSHSSAVLSHYLFVFGGETGDSISNKIEVFDLDKEVWLGNTINGIKRSHFTAITSGGDVLLFGGLISNLASNAFEKFSLKNKEFGDISGQFTGKVALPVNLSQHSSVSLSDGSILVHGGFEVNSTTLNPNTYRYSSKDKSWVTTMDTNAPTLRRGHNSNYVDEKVYSWGGYLANGLVNNQMSVYDTSLKLWSEALYGGTSRAQHMGNLSNGKLYFTGGNDNSVNPNSITTIVDIFDLDTWSEEGSISVSLSEHAMEINSDQLYIWGGKFNEVIQNNLVAYDLVTQTELPVLDGGTARIDHCSTTFDDKVYFWGGYAGSGAINTLDVYDIKDNRWIEGISGGTARQGHDCTSDGKYMYVWGGSSNALIQNSLERYTINPFATSNLTTTHRLGATADIYDSVVYIYGGTSTNVLDNMDTLQSVSNSFVLTTNLYPSGNKKVFHASTVKQDKIYYFGGIDETGTYLPNMEIFDPIAKTWDNTKPSNVKGLAGAALVNSSNFILVVGGEFNPTEINESILRYDSVINQWETSNVITSPIIGRSYHSAVLVTNIVYVYGGRVTKATTTPFYTNTFQAFSILDFTSIGPAQSNGRERAYHKSHYHDGSVYVYGGIDNSGNIVKTVDRYDIATNKWFLGVNVGDPRAFEGSSQKSATFSTGEKFYFYGGSDKDNQALTTLTSYDPVRWRTLSSGPEPKINVMGEYFNNRIYYWGGIDASTRTNNNLNIYDVTQNSWSVGVAGGRPRFKAASSINQDKILYYGGRTGVNETIPNTSVATVDIFDIATNKWYIGGTNTKSRERHQIVSYQGNILIGGGVDYGSSIELNTLESYVVNPWTVGTNSPIKFKLHSADAKDGILYTYGGLSDSGQILNDLLSYNTVLNAWSSLDSQGDFRFGHKGVISQNRFYNFGGEDSSSILSSIDIFDIGSDSWISGYRGGQARKDHSINVFNGGINLIGGVNASNNVTSSFDNYAISVSNLGWRTEVYTGLARSYGAISELDNKLYLHGGKDQSGTVHGDLFIYDLSSKSTEVQTITTYIRAGHSVSHLGDSLYYFGGFPSKESNNDLMEYNTSTSTWSLKDRKSVIRYFHHSSINNGILSVFGGENEQGVLPTIDRYDFDTQKWLNSRFTLYTRSKLGLGTFDNKSFIFGGESLKNVANNNFEFYDHDIVDKNNSPKIITANVISDGSSLHNIRIGFTLKDSDSDPMSVTVLFKTDTDKDYYPIVYSHLSGSNQNLSNGSHILTWNAIKDLSLDSALKSIDFKIVVSDGLDSSSSIVKGYNVQPFLPTLFTNLPNFLDKKSSHTSSLVNGVVYVYGGFNVQGVPSDTLKQYFVNDNHWLLDFIPAPQPRAEHTASYMNEKIYHFGGVGSGGLRSDFSVYNIIPANEWVTGDIPATTARHRHSAIITGNEIWMIAGRTNTGVTNSIDVYNTLSKTWRSETSSATAREYHDSFVYENKLYIIGGTDSAGSFVLEPDIYDLSSQVWSKGEPAPFGLKEQSAVLWNDKIILLGGNVSDSTVVVNDKILMYNINEGTWTSAIFPGISRRNADVVLNRSTIDSIFIIGGEVDNQLDTIERFNLGK